MTPHLVLVPVSLRSHLRLLVQLAVRLLREHPVGITFLFTSTVNRIYEDDLGRVDKATASMLDERTVRIVMEDGLPPGAKAFPEKMAFKKLCGPELERLARGESRYGRPCVVLTDMFRTSLRKDVTAACEATRTPRIPVCHFMPSMALASLRYIRSGERDGAAEGMMERYRAYRADGLDEEGAALKSFRHIENKLLGWPDLPAMYDSPQTAAKAPKEGGLIVLRLVFAVSRATDGILCNGMREIDPGAIKDIHVETGVPCYGIGAHVWHDQMREGNPVIEFLDRAERTHGSRSAVYISFGSLFWPSDRPDYITLIVDTLLKRGTPFVFAHAGISGDDAIPDELRSKVGDRGLFTEWAPQVQVLHHPATGGFLTHCGWGSLVETIMAGVPIIALPFSVDQPSLAAHFCHIQRIGHLLEHWQTCNEGRRLASGTVVDSSPPSMRRELDTALTRILAGAERERLKELKQVFLDSETGGSRSALQEWIQHFA